MTKLQIALICTFILSALSIAFLTKFAHLYGFVSKVDFRRTAKSKIPLLGGVGIYFSFFIVSFSFFNSPETKIFFLTSIPIFLIGIADDIWELTPKAKFSAQFLSIFIWCSQSSSMSLLSQAGLPLYMVNLFSGIWILGAMNSTNMLDGIDGIASSFAIVGCFAVGFLPGQIHSQNLWLMAAAYAGFLIFNFAPAKIYLGDLGSQLIGLFLSTQLLEWRPENFSGLDLFVPLLVFCLPQVDALLAITRRLRSGQSALHADQDHLHHKILRSLGSVRTTWVMMTIIIMASSTASLMAASSLQPIFKIGILVSTICMLTTILWWTLKTESIMTKRLMEYGKILIQRHFKLQKQLTINRNFKSGIVVYDLTPYYLELQSHGLEKLERFVESFHDFVKMNHSAGTAYLVNQHSVAVTDHRIGGQQLFRTNLCFHFSDLTKKFNVEKSEASEPTGMKFFAQNEIELFAKQYDLEYDKVAMPEKIAIAV